MGLWHAVSLKWFLWGLWHASGIIVYSRWARWKKKKLKGKSTLPKPAAFAIGMALTVLYSALGFAFITQPTAPDALKLLAAIFT
jgi:alginate O-acetyltransferase complex protein AlgI